MYQSTEYLLPRLPYRPGIILTLGTGLGGLEKMLRIDFEADYQDIPGFPVCTVEGHAGKLLVGKIGDTPLYVFSGRCHYYEGYPLQQIAYVIRTMKELGAGILFQTNATGGVNLSFRPGDMMLVEDHLNLCGQNPLFGSNDEAFGPRFPDMCSCYSQRLRSIVEAAAKEENIHLQHGVYANMAGPSFETPAEIRMLRILGADVVGMSTVPEAIAANHCGMENVAISTVSNMGAGILPQPLTHEEVLENGARLTDRLYRLLSRCIPMMDQA